MDNRRGLGRNDPCWCGSGRKYKKCHLGRGDEEPDHPFEAFKKITALNRKRMCLHPSAPAGCSDKIIRAHTIQRAQSLERIAEDGHLLGFSTDPRSWLRNEGPVEIERIGIHQASTFSGFCSHHDNTTFAPVDDEPFTASDEQCFLLGYRALCREVYQKETQLDAMEAMRTLDRGRSLGEQVALQQFLDKCERAAAAGQRDLKDRKSTYDQILLARSFSDMFKYVIFTKGIPDVLATFGAAVAFDFQGHRLQELSAIERPIDALYVSMVGTETGGAIVFTWRDIHSDACSKFVGSLAAIADGDIPDAVVRFVFEYSENTFFRPSWWAALSEPLQLSLRDRIASGAAPGRPRTQGCLASDGNRYASWQVVRRETNCGM